MHFSHIYVDYFVKIVENICSIGKMTLKDIISEVEIADKDSSVVCKLIDSLSCLLEKVKEGAHIDYTKVMRDISEVVNGKHYIEVLAREDVDAMCSVDENGVEHKGEYWTCEEVVSEMSNRSLPQGTTDWDIYVACNLFWHNLKVAFTDEDIIEAAYRFFFKDDTCNNEGKVWNYMKYKNCY